MIIRKTPEEVAKIAAAGDVLVRTLRLLEGKIRPGVTTAELDTAAERFIRSQGGEPGRGPELEEGMVLAVEPMVTAGRHAVRMGDDHWAIFSQDGSLAAHFEFTVAVTAQGPRILTPWHEDAKRAAA